MAGKKKSKQKNGPSTPLTFGPSYSIANSSAASTTTTTINKTPLLTTTTSGSPTNNVKNKNNNKNSNSSRNQKVFNPSISYFDSISTVDKRISEGEGDSSAFNFEELSAIINGQSTDVNGCFRNNRDKQVDSGSNNIKAKATNQEKDQEIVGADDKSGSVRTRMSSDSPGPDKTKSESKSTHQRNNKKEVQKKDVKGGDSAYVEVSAENDDRILYNNNEDELDNIMFPKIVRVCSLVANATNQASAHISKSNKSKSLSSPSTSTSTSTFEDDSSSNGKYARTQNSNSSLLGDGPNFGGVYAKENGGANYGSNMNIGGFEDGDDEVDDSIISDYPDESQFYNLENAGHFLTGSGGLETLSTAPMPNSYDDVPKLASCTTMWDGIINICEISTCSKGANKKCGLCKAAYYCGEEHQRQDWRKHRNECIAYKLECVGNRDLDGPVWAMVATRNIPEGELIFTEKPVLVLPLAQPTENFTHVMDLECVRNGGDGALCKATRPSCFGCLKPIDTTVKDKEDYKCSKCGLLLCSQKCEYSMDHINHECHAITSSGPWTTADLVNNCLHCLYMDIEILRAIRMAYYGNANEEWDSFLKLKHTTRVKAYRSTDQFYTFTKQMSTLVPYSAKVSQYNFDLIADIHSILTAFSYKPSLDTPFKLLFEIQSLFVHACIPNTLHFVDNLRSGNQHQMKLMTKACVPIVRGETISVDFVPSPYLPFKTRKTCLKNLSIACACVRCRRPSEHGDHSSDIKCPNCRDGFVRAEAAEIWEESVWSCHICQEELPFSNISRIEKEANSTLTTIPKTRDGLRALIDFVEKKQAVLHPSHCLMITAWSFIESIIRENIEDAREPTYLKRYDEATLEEFKLLLRYCEAVGPHMDLVRQGLWVDKGMMLFHKFYAKFVLASYEFQTKSIVRKEYISRVFKAMKALQEALKHLITSYEGGTAPKSVSRLIQEGTYAMSTLREFVSNLIVKEAAENNTNNHYRLTATATAASTSTPSSTNL